MKTTISTFQKLKGKQKITSLTAYDALFASIFDGEVDMILVGDSLSMNFAGNKDTIPIGIDSMIYHTKVVSNAINQSLLISDMPFGTYYNKKIALKNAIRLYKEGGADAVKLEVNDSKVEIVRELTNNGIAIMAHIGLMPQFYRFEGAYKVKGKNEQQKRDMISLALRLQDAGAFSLLLECITSEIAHEITEKLDIPTIGIGSGNGTDGQILVWSDAFGFFDEFKPKFVKQYLNGKELIKNAITKYVSDVKSSKFPSKDESYL